MSHTEDSNTDQPNPAADAELAALLNAAGARPQPSSTAEQAAFAELRREWQAKAAAHQAQRRRRTLSVLSAAAAVVMTVFAAWYWQPMQNDTWQVEVATGDFIVEGRASDATAAGRVTGTRTLRLQPHDVLSITTPTRLTLSTGTDLRLAAASRLRWLHEDEIELNSGRAYVDTKNLSDFSIHTPFGEVRDIGTRYMVELQNDGMSVAVREGAAQIDTAHGSSTARAEALDAAIVHVDRSGMHSRREPASDARWEWIHDVGAGYQDRTVPALLDAIARDLGKRIDYRSHGVAATVANTAIQGKLEGLPPRAALHLVANSTGLQWEESDTRITVDFNR